jgi:primase-polymerase (primpol)-like protein
MNRLPGELVNYKQWVVWRRAEVGGRNTKLPISPWSGKVASCDKPHTWSTFRHGCYARQKHRCDGIGFVFTEEDPFCGIDLDGCRDADGNITPEASAIISRLDSYTELSPSGTGVHILVRAKLPGKGRRSGKIEIYDSARYFTMTGNHLPGAPVEILERQMELDQLLHELFPAALRLSTSAYPEPSSLSDEELIRRAQSARNGERFLRLWNGDSSEYGGDRSRADAALCCILAYWCGGDPDRVDRLFRQSGLMRSKWDRRSGDTTYSALTIRSALELFLAD